MGQFKVRSHTQHVKKYFKVAFIFLGLFLVSAVICLLALRHNNFEMGRLRGAVYAADKSGIGVEDALQNLQSYVTSHMNTNLDTAGGISPPIQLRYTYERAQEATTQGISKSNQQLYTRAQDYCQNKFPTAYFAYVQCNQDYLASHDINIKIGVGPSPDLFKFDFASPTWSPDLAGWSLVVAVSALLSALVSLLVGFTGKTRKTNTNQSF